MNNFSIRDLKVSLSASKKHHILFFSPVLKRLVIPYAVQTDIFFESASMIFSADDDNEEEAVKIKSVGSVCNTHTKQRNPAVNEQLKGVSGVL